MARAFRWVLVLAILGGAGFALVHWPRLNVVETGRTPEYPDLQPREYRAPEETVARAVRAALGRLPGWKFVGSGRGPGGTEFQATAEVPVLTLGHDVSIRLRHDGGRTRMTVRSSSRTGPWDFGQNARFIRQLFAEVDRQLGPV
jgi:uncharacterized protein (DUF1499 family)